MDDIKKFVVEKDLERFDYYIEKADNKASFILAFAGALLVAVAFQSNTIVGLIKVEMLKKTLIYALLITSIFLFLTCVFALLVIIPRTPAGTYKSMLFFEDVKSMGEREFINLINSANDNNLIEDVSKQIIAIANVCSKKMKRVRYSLLCLSGAGILVILITQIVLLYM